LRGKYQWFQKRASIMACASYLQSRQPFEKSKQELHQPTHLFPSIKMSLNDHFQKNTLFPDRWIQLDLISLRQ
jgi:hypothetical protein